MATIAENIAAKKAREAGTSSASTEVLLGSGAGKINAATSALKTATSAVEEVINTLNGNLGELSLKIAAGEAKVQDLADQAAEDKRRNKIEVALEYQADQAAAAQSYASSNNKTIIDSAVYQREQAAAQKLEADFEKELRKQVAIETDSLTTKHGYELKAVQAEYQTKEAGNLARLSSQEQTIATLTATIQQLRDDATAVREAEVKRAQAGSIQNLNVGAPQR